MKALLLVAGMAVATALVSGALLVGRGPAAPGPSPGPAPGAALPPAGGAPSGGAPDAADRETVLELRNRIRALEARLDELAARADSIPSLPGSSRAPAAPETGDREPETSAAAAAGTTEWIEGVQADVQSVVDPKAGKKESRREAEIRRRIDRAVEAMGLTPQERARVEEIARSHVEKADAITLRARDLLGNSPFGFTEADRAAVEQLAQDRARLDRETEQTLVQFVGPERWKAGLKLEKEQEAKEKALKRLEKPW